MHSEVVWGYVKISSIPWIPWIPWRKSLVGACMGVRQSLFSKELTVLLMYTLTQTHVKHAKNRMQVRIKKFS